MASKTEENLKIAFANESQARTRYQFFADVAKREGYDRVADVFQKIAENEKQHAKLWFKAMGMFRNDTEKNLAAAAAGEREEWAQIYAQFAQDAEREGHLELAEQFRAVANIEKVHEQKFLYMAQSLQAKKPLLAEESWECLACGHVLHGKDGVMPKACPLCEGNAFADLS